MDAYFWNFNKRENSTKTPTSTGTKITIKLKDRVEVDNPVLLCQTNIMSYNYMQFEGSYYFIRRKTYVNNSLFEIEATRDALATLKTEIKGSTQYVNRSSVSPDNLIFDNMYPLKTRPKSSSTPSTNNILSWDNPTYLITIKGKGGSQIFATNKASIGYLANTIYSTSQNDIWTAIGSLPGSAFKEFSMTYFDTFSYIVDCRVVPVPFNSEGGVTWLDLGPLHFNDDAAAFVDVTTSPYIKDGSETINYGLLSYVADNNRYLYSNKSRTVSVYLPGVGDVSIDVERAIDNVTLNPASGVFIKWEIDNRGHIAYKIQSGVDIQFTSADISVPQALYSNIENVGGVISGVSRVAAATAGGLALGGIVGGVGGFVSGAASAISSAGPLYKTSTLGSDGSKASTHMQTKAILYETQYIAPDLAPNFFGYPCCKTMTLSANGYYLIDNPVVDFGDDLEIRNAVIGYMRSGFYVE